jgi:hypothetical protein
MEKNGGSGDWAVLNNRRLGQSDFLFKVFSGRSSLDMAALIKSI